MSATLLNRFGDKGINPIGASSMGCILNTYHVNLDNIFLELTFFPSDTAWKYSAISA